MDHDQAIGSSPSSFEITIQSSPANLATVRAAAMRMAELEGFPEPEARNICLALDEALANVIKHGYSNACDKPIHIRLDRVASDDGRHGLCVQVRDFGRQVDPSTIRGRDLDDVRPGGLGVHIMTSVMDEVQYTRVPEGGMLLKMFKYRPAG